MSYCGSNTRTPGRHCLHEIRSCKTKEHGKFVDEKDIESKVDFVTLRKCCWCAWGEAVEGERK